MSSLNVLVFKDDKPQPNALVRLDGPSGPKLMNTNGIGAANFMGLVAGKYYVAATLSGQALGVGYMNLTEGGGGTILFKYPPKRIGQKQGNQTQSNPPPPLLSVNPWSNIFVPGWSYGYGVDPQLPMNGAGVNP